MNEIKPPIIDFSVDYSEKTGKQFTQLLMEFNNAIGNDYEIVLHTPNITEPIFLKNITFCKPNLVVLDGTLNNAPVRLIQNLSQLCVGILAKKRLNPDSPKTPIGFHYEG